MKVEAKKLGKDVKVPDDFYMKIAERHEDAQKNNDYAEDKSVDASTYPASKATYYHNHREFEFKAKVIKVDENRVILDETKFYPTSGGQDNDTGIMIHNGIPYSVVDVIKKGPTIIHVLEKSGPIHEGDEVIGKIDSDRRLQLTQHHSATHIVNAAAKRVLGPHINQAGARKTVQKAHIDLTHFQSITEEEQKKIEEEANRIIQAKIPVEKAFFPRGEAEQKFGVNIYQGGVVPGKELRIVNILGTDVEACGGTHVDNTSEVEKIRILKTTKIQDGIVRVQFTAGKAAMEAESQAEDLVGEIAGLLGIGPEMVPARATELFEKWKKAGKFVKKLSSPDYVTRVKAGEAEKPDLTLSSTDSFSGDVLQETAKLLKTQKEHIPKTIKRFLSELEGYKKLIEEKLA